MSGSGPKGRGFESRHFDFGGKPGNVTVSGLLLCPELWINLWKNCGKLGEKTGLYRLEPLIYKGLQLGELGEMKKTCPGMQDTGTVDI